MSDWASAQGNVRPLWGANTDLEVQKAIEAVGATLRYLPAYSPDLNPIELSYSAFKAFLRKCAERTEEALRRRIGQFVRRLSAEACANFFAHAGYAAT